eukprot:Hpha_TRINITY_DN9353_c0_g1::TRINITY_DN9353_c0_g1_i1::g.26042::m.26042
MGSAEEHSSEGHSWVSRWGWAAVWNYAELIACLQGIAIVAVDFSFDQRVALAGTEEKAMEAAADALSYYRTVIRAPQINLIVLLNLTNMIFPYLRRKARKGPGPMWLGLDCDLAEIVFNLLAWGTYGALVIPLYFSAIACYAPALPECGGPVPLLGVHMFSTVQPTMVDVLGAVEHIFRRRLFGYVFFTLGTAFTVAGHILSRPSQGAEVPKVELSASHTKVD